MRFPLAYSPVWRVLMTVLALGPRRSGLELDEREVVIVMGWAFQAHIPRAGVVSAARQPRRRLSIGVHGWRGDWLVNGSGHGIVLLEIDPPAAARAVGVHVRLRRLSVSLESPDAFLDELRPAAR
jgi:hypothetical protein